MKLRERTRQWLGIDREHQAFKNDIRVIMEKQLEFQKQYPLEDTDMLPPDLPPVEKGHVFKPNANEGSYGYYVLWDEGFAGPFDFMAQADAYLENHSKAIPNGKVKRLYCYGLTTTE